MVAPSFEYQKTSNISSEQLENRVAQLEPEQSRIRQARELEYATPYAFINLPFDISQLEVIQLVIDEKKRLKPTLLIVIGIGGSHLGTLAIHQAFNGLYYNEQHPDIAVFFIDSIDPAFVSTLYAHTEQHLKNKKKIILNIVSKSGTTLETAINAQLFLDLLKQYCPDSYAEYVVITTDEQSSLWHYAQTNNFTCLTIPELVGGRYSVLSSVGLFPLGLLGIDIEQLLVGAQTATHDALDANKKLNTAAIRASLLYIYYQQNILIHNLFLFAANFTQFGFWYRQLIAESLGKDGTGITPLVSVASADLHSIIQLYLGGPRNQSTTFITIDHPADNLTINHSDIIREILTNPRDVTLSEVLRAQSEGVIATYTNLQLPFSRFKIPDSSPFAIGWLMQTMMIETVYLGFLLKINPFDQPQVHVYKQAVLEVLNNRVP